jgi:hypothetical protein
VSSVSMEAEAGAFEKDSIWFKDFLREYRLLTPAQLDQLVSDLHKYRSKFHQDRDPRRWRLFINATARYFIARRNATSKRGYPFVKALEDENNSAHLIPLKEFDLDFVNIANHYKVWRNKNRDLVQEIQQRNAVVT